LKVAKAASLTVDELHFVVETFGAAAVAGEAPHGGDRRQGDLDPGADYLDRILC